MIGQALNKLCSSPPLPNCLFDSSSSVAFDVATTRPAARNYSAITSIWGFCHPGGGGTRHGCWRCWLAPHGCYGRVQPLIIIIDTMGLSYCIYISKIFGIFCFFLCPRHFVPNLTIGPPVIQSLRKHTNLFLDCHLMVTDPGKWVEDFGKAGANSITFHIEAASMSSSPPPCFQCMDSAAVVLTNMIRGWNRRCGGTDGTN